ncbi:HAD family hydrolase [Kribbella sp. CA-294648]|uniref:HAD family hydrolase n=1 Tax=Kribbella sp. CA-294648 TaxID=3239948 RepID=UPI003D8A0569
MAGRVVLLDLDGTIWDSAPWYEGLANLSTLSIPAGLNAAKMLKAKGYTEARLRRALGDGVIGPELYSGVEEALDEVRRGGALLGAVTNLPGWMVRPMLEGTGLTRYMDAVVDYGATRKHKPNPEPLLAALDLLGCDAEESWYIGDHPDDALAATAAGMQFAWASWGYSENPPKEPVQILTDPADIASLVRDSS